VQAQAINGFLIACSMLVVRMPLFYKAADLPSPWPTAALPYLD
jgi:hypothetical protein